MKALCCVIVLIVLFSTHCFSQTAEEFISKGKLKNSRADFVGAIKDFKTAIAIDKKYEIEAYGLIADIYFKHKGFLLAIEFNNKILDKDSTNFCAKFNKARSYFNLSIVEFDTNQAILDREKGFAEWEEYNKNSINCGTLRNIEQKFFDRTLIINEFIWDSLYKDQIPSGPFVGSGETPPVADFGEIHSKIIYPELAKQGRIEGKVLIAVYINKAGRPTKTKILKSDNPIFEKSVEEAVMKCFYVPASQGGYLVSCWLQVPIEFKLKDAE
jgi:TonB family protein